MTAMFLRFLLGGFNFARTAFLSACRWIAAHPMQAALIALVVALIWTWRDDNKQRDRVASRNAEIAALHQASDNARAAAEAQRKTVEAHYTQLAKDSDNAHAHELAQANDAVDRYIAAHRVRGPVQANLGTPGPGPSGDDPGVAAGMPGSAVVVAEADLRICAARATDSVAAHDWAQSLIAQGLAIPGR